MSTLFEPHLAELLGPARSSVRQPVEGIKSRFATALDALDGLTCLVSRGLKARSNNLLGTP